MRIVTISGSLRAASSNTAALEALAALAPLDVDLALYDGMGALPHFNPDLDVDGGEVPPPVMDLRERLRASDGVVISSPEYAHGVPGSMKNLLDWLVSDGLLVDKPVLLINATPPAQFAHASLIETLRTMSWRVVEAVEVPLRGKKLDAKGIAADPDLSSMLRDALDRFLQSIRGT